MAFLNIVLLKNLTCLNQQIRQSASQRARCPTTRRVTNMERRHFPNARLQFLRKQYLTIDCVHQGHQSYISLVNSGQEPRKHNRTRPRDDIDSIRDPNLAGARETSRASFGIERMICNCALRRKHQLSGVHLPALQKPPTVHYVRRPETLL